MSHAVGTRGMHELSLRKLGKAFCLITVISLCGAMATEAWGLVIVGYNATEHNRFLNFNTASMVHNPNFIGSEIESSGVGYYVSNFGYSGTLVSPKHFLTSTHRMYEFGLSGAPTQSFLGTDGLLRTYNVQSYVPLTYTDFNNPSITYVSDLMLGTLAGDGVSGDPINYFAVPGLSPSNYYVDKEIVAFGANGIAHGSTGSPVATPTGGTNEIHSLGVQNVSGVAIVGSVTSPSFFTAFEPGVPDQAALIQGDSSSPSFINVDGTWTLVGIHTAAGEGDDQVYYSIDTFVPYFISQINALMQADGSGYQLTVVAVPEPATWALSLAGLVACAPWLRRRRRMLAA